MFSGCTVPPDSKETELGSSDQEASPSAGKNTGVVLVPCSCTEVLFIVQVKKVSYERKVRLELLACFFFIVHWSVTAHMFLLQALG